MRRRQRRSLWRDRRGMGAIEAVASAFVLSMVVIAMSFAGAGMADRSRQGQALRSGIELAAVLDAETASPSVSDIEEIARAMRIAAGLEEGEIWRVHIAVFKHDHLLGSLVTDWQGSFGPGAAPSQVSIAGPHVEIGAASLAPRDDERLVVVEMYRSVRGMSHQEEGFYMRALSFFHDPDHA